MKKFLGIAFAALVGIAGASAQNYPVRPVTMIVPFPPGGLTDAVARALVEGMQGPLGQSVVIENIGGAGGSIGSLRLLRLNLPNSKMHKAITNCLRCSNCGPPLPGQSTASRSMVGSSVWSKPRGSVVTQGFGSALYPLA